MKVLVTGAAGFLGSYFARAHVQAGDVVLAIDDFSNARFADLDELDDYTGPLNWARKEDALKFFDYFDEEFDLAYHFAAPVGGRLKIDGDPLFNAHSLALDEAFFRWAVRWCKKVVYPSSSAVYGVERQKSNAEPLVEDQFEPSGWAWYAPDQMYGFTKLAGEYLAWKAAGYGVNTLCIRPFSGYGEGQSFDYPTPSIAARVLKREDPLGIWGSGRQTRDFVHVDDIVAVTRARLEQPLEGYESLNIGSGIETSFRQMAELYADIVGYQPEIVTDESKPEGVSRRFADIGRMRTYYDKPLIPLWKGLTRVLADVETRLAVAAK